MSGATAYDRVLVTSQAFLDPGWLPPAADCAELADLRAEHERLLAACGDARARVSDARLAFELASEARDEGLREAIAAGKDPREAELLTPDDGPVKEARRVYEAACEVLEAFVGRAQEQVEERAPIVREGLAALLRDAQAKRAEARRLLDEADRLEAEPRRMLNWLDRYTGDSVLGPIAYETLDLPVRVPVPPLFDEIAGLPPATVVGVGSDDPADEEREAMRRA